MVSVISKLSVVGLCIAVLLSPAIAIENDARRLRVANGEGETGHFYGFASAEERSYGGNTNDNPNTPISLPSVVPMPIVTMTLVLVPTVPVPVPVPLPMLAPVPTVTVPVPVPVPAPVPAPGAGTSGGKPASGNPNSPVQRMG